MEVRAMESSETSGKKRKKDEINKGGEVDYFSIAM